MGTTAGSGTPQAGATGQGRQELGGIGPWLKLFAGIGGAAVGISVALGLLVVLATSTAHARSGGDALAALHQLQAHRGSGMILMTTEGPAVAPLQSTDARLVVTGNTVRGTVTQRFRNPGTEWLEGSYLFPLPDDAAVDHLRMKVGDRVVEGEVREREAARKAFAQARSDGRRATLVEQQRPNAFTTHVTNIAPGAAIEIELQYQQTLAMRDGAWRLRLPGVVAPRYGSSQGKEGSREDLRDDARNADSPEVDFAEQSGEDGEDDESGEGNEGNEGGARIAHDPGWRAPRLHQGFMRVGTRGDPEGELSQPIVAEGEAPLNPIRITVELDAGVPISQPVSASHRLQIARVPGDGDSLRYRLQTIAGAEAQEVADRDFELEWAPAAAALPGATMRYERRGDSYYGMLVINPPSPDVGPGDRLPRETTFVVDTSGSMGGESIQQARSALAFGLERLQSGDRFNIIQFNSTHASLFPASRPASPDNLRLARRYVGSLRADGGTEMRGAILQALSAPLAEGMLGQVVFITDGAVDYEDELVSLVRERLDQRRLFTVGIGSAPNGFFMRKAAEIGGGTFTYIGNTREVERRMAQLFARIAQPMSTDLAVTLDGGVLAEPIDMPRDLYAGEPLILSARFSELPRAITVSGAAGVDGAAARWRIPVALAAAPDTGLHVLWARSRIEELTDRIRQARHTAAPQDELRQQVVKIALNHHLTSAYTSLVAVDLTPVRPSDAPMDRGAVPANLPAGWMYDAVTSQTGAVLARTATPAPLQLLAGLGLLAVGFLLLISRRGSRFLASGARE